MQRFPRGLLTALLSACACLWAASAPAQAQIAYSPCADSNDFGCGHLVVPLDPSGTTPGTITLALRRHRAPVGEARSAIIALAGGPGQPALPFAELFSELLGPIASTRDLIVFDQRGIGLSGPLSCHAFETAALFHSLGALIETCAEQLGPTRSLYTTADTVADIEAIRQAGGYEKLVLYGTSYGTKVAEDYARTYPGHVEALVLDSVVGPNGPQALERSTFAAVPRILRQLCAARACVGITSHPVADLARVVTRVTRAPLFGRAFDGRGRGHRVRLTSDELVALLLAGDFSPMLRAEFLTGVAAAARADTAPLAQLLNAASSAEGEGEGEDFDTPLFYATSCEEEDFPFSRAATPKARIGQAIAAAAALGAGAFAPFTAADALALGDVPACAYWPFTSPAPAPDDAPLPNVPTLILSGADDLRTPTANAREVARVIPDSKLLVVPDTGHSVLTEETTQCASEALQALFKSHAIHRCAVAPAPAALRPPPLPPTRLAAVPAAAGYGGVPGRTARAVSLTLAALARQLLLRLSLSGSFEALALPPTLRSGGLRGGWAQFAGGTLSVHGYSYVPGVTLSGSIRTETADVRVGGASASHGSLRLGPRRSLVGSLGGRRVALPATQAAATAIVGEDAVASFHGPLRSAARSAARGILALLGGSNP